MNRARDHDQIHRSLRALVCGGEFFRLSRRHLRIGFTMDEQQRRIVRVDVLHGAGEFWRDRLSVGWPPAELQAGTRIFKPCSVLLLEDGRKIRSAEKADDPLYVALSPGRSPTVPSSSFSIGDADESGEVTACEEPVMTICRASMPSPRLLRARNGSRP